jgi:polyhydroxyalkanoate synthesis regulator phasin
MGMTIDEAIGIITAKGNYSYTVIENEAKDVLVDTARKYQMVRVEYENRLKADMVAMLEELDFRLSNYQDTDLIRQDVQEKITKLRGNKNGNE